MCVLHQDDSDFAPAEEEDVAEEYDSHAEYVTSSEGEEGGEGGGGDKKKKERRVAATIVSIIHHQLRLLCKVLVQLTPEGKHTVILSRISQNRANSFRDNDKVFYA